MWTEILTEDICVTHVGDWQVVTPLDDDVEAKDVRWVYDYLERRQALEYQKEQVRDLAAELRRQQRVAAQLKGTEYEGLI